MLVMLEHLVDLTTIPQIHIVPHALVYGGNCSNYGACCPQAEFTCSNIAVLRAALTI